MLDNSEPAITVLMSVYNTPPVMLEQAIQSILDQSFQDFEFLILDDGSGDDGIRQSETRELLEQSACADARIKLAFEPHRGLTRTLNLGLERARGKFVARQDADDWSAPGRLERQFRLLESRADLSVCGTNAEMHQHDGRALWSTRLPESREQIWEAFWHGNPFVHGSTMFLRRAALAIGGYREQFPCSQDYDFFWRLSEMGGGENLRGALYHYRFTAGSISMDRAAEQSCVHHAAQLLARARRAGEVEDVPGALESAAKQWAGEYGGFRAALKQADHRLLAGDYWGALKSYSQLLREHPRDPLAWGKLARWAVFAGVPYFRQASFRPGAAGAP